MTYKIILDKKEIATLQTSAFGDSLLKIVEKLYGKAANAVFIDYETEEEEGDYQEHEMLLIK